MRDPILDTDKCICPHPVSEHGNDGCLIGWGDPSTLGCLCTMRGAADAW